MSLTVVLQEDRRLVILRTLSEVPSFTLNEGILRTALRQIGHPEETKDLVRADIQFLADHGLVRIETLAMPSGDLWVVHLLDAGQEVADGRAHPGVARRKPQG
jgi:hypothetical protein